MARHDEGKRAAAFEGERTPLAPSVLRTSFGTDDHGVEQLGEIDRRASLALQFGVEAAGIGDVGDQPVEPPHVVLDDREQPLLALRRFGERQVSTAERSEVSGFFSSCATSAAKLSIASMRL